MIAPIVTAAAIADDALEFVRYGKEQTRWLSALMKAIALDVRHNQGRQSEDLAALGQYIAYDCSNYLDCHAETLQGQLNAIGGDA